MGCGASTPVAPSPGTIEEKRREAFAVFGARSDVTHATLNEEFGVSKADVDQVGGNVADRTRHVLSNRYQLASAEHRSELVCYAALRRTARSGFEPAPLARASEL